MSLGEGKQAAARLTIGFAAHHTGDGRSIDAVLEHADQAMYNKRRRRRRRAAGS
jgi:GGDEF domain-containing protein